MQKRFIMEVEKKTHKHHLGGHHFTLTSIRTSRLHFFFSYTSYTIVKYTSQKYLWNIWKKQNIKSEEATKPDFYIICCFCNENKCMISSTADQNLLISVKYFFPRCIWPFIQYVTLCSHTSRCKMHIDNHVDFLLDNTHKLFFFFFFLKLSSTESNG